MSHAGVEAVSTPEPFTAEPTEVPTGTEAGEIHQTDYMQTSQNAGELDSFYLTLPQLLILIRIAVYFDSDPETVLVSASSHVHHYDPALEFNSLTPSHHAQRYNPLLEFGLPASFTQAEQYNPALEFGSQSSVAQAQEYDFLLDPELPEGFRDPHQYNNAAEADVPEGFQNSQHYDPSLNLGWFEGFQTTFPYDPALDPVLPECSEYSQEYDTGIDPAAPDTSKYSPQYDPLLTPMLPEGSEYCQQHAPLLYPALPDGFQNSQQYNLAAAENTAARRRQARGSSLRPEVAPSAGFQAQASNHEGDGTEAEPRRAIRESECSVDAAERNIWHVAMNKHGVYRPSGELQRSEDGTMQWREHERGRWCKCSQSSDEVHSLFNLGNAVKHGDIREKLLAECARLGEYSENPRSWLYPRC